MSLTPIDPSTNLSTDPSTDTPTDRLDLRGTPCPINFVRTKLKLQEMLPGSLLEVWLDAGEPIEQVPASLAGAGYPIEATEPRMQTEPGAIPGAVSNPPLGLAPGADQTGGKPTGGDRPFFVLWVRRPLSDPAADPAADPV